jgi:hypothetical protein
MKNHGATPATDVHVWCAVVRVPVLAKVPEEIDTTIKLGS